MQKDVIINIQDTHSIDGESQTAELLTTGTLTGFGELYSLTYAEQDNGLKNCITTLVVEGNKKITMSRQGHYKANFVMEKGKRHNCHYSTPHGDILMGVYTSNISSDMKENGGKLVFKYTIDFNASHSSENELKITVKEADGNVCVS